MNGLAIVFVITKTIANQFIAEAVMQKLVNFRLWSHFILKIPNTFVVGLSLVKDGILTTAHCIVLKKLLENIDSPKDISLMVGTVDHKDRKTEL
jgi:hypothetical protein